MKICRLIFFITAIYTTSAMALINAQLVDPKLNPYSVLLTLNEQRCSGTLIGPRTVLTAAHCLGKSLRLILKDRPLPAVTVQGKESVRIIETNRVLVHPDYESDDKVDLALLYLEEKVDLIDFPTLSSHPVKKENELQVYGFGRQDPNQSSDSKLRALSISVDHAEVRVFSSFTPLEGTCVGDSGGGVFKNNNQQIVGVTFLVLPDMTKEQLNYFSSVNFDRQKLNAAYPFIDVPCMNSKNYYQQIYPYKNWIDTNVK